MVFVGVVLIVVVNNMTTCDHKLVVMDCSTSIPYIQSTLFTQSQLIASQSLKVINYSLHSIVKFLDHTEIMNELFMKYFISEWLSK